MKKTISFLLVLVLLTSLFAAPVFAYREISVYVNGRKLEFDVPPQIINNRTMVPMRAIFEALGANVYWLSESRSISATKLDSKIFMKIDNPVIIANGETVVLDVAPTIVDDRTLVPVRAVSESLNAEVSWDAATRTVYVDVNRMFEDVAAFDFLSSWLMKNGTAFADHVYIDWKMRDNGENFKITYYPADGDISFSYYTPDNSVLTMIFLWPVYSNGLKVGIESTYINRSYSANVSGDINMKEYTKNSPISYRQCTPGEWGTAYNALEFTRNRINTMLITADLILTLGNTCVTVNSLGFNNFY